MTTPTAGERGASPTAHATTYRVRFDEAGPDGLLRTSGWMRYAQDLAWLHSTALGFGREWYAERGLTWLVRAAELVVVEPVLMGTILDASTEVVGMRRVFARRRGLFRLPAGEVAAWVNTDWVLIDRRGALTRIPPIFTEMFGGSGQDVSIARVNLPPTPDSASHTSFVVRPADLDPMAHANNAVYLDWVEEALDGTDARGAVAATPRRYRLEYALAAESRAPLDAAAWPGDAAWNVRLTQRATGADCFRARLEPIDAADALMEVNG
jgi:acyl-ACP thioesterase